MSLSSTIWNQLPPLPDAEGFAGMFAGTHNQTLICAGGTNFPEKPMLEGGPKTWTDKIFTLTPGATAWKEAGSLPRPYAYGASVSIDAGVLLIGGCDKEAHRSDVYLISTQADKVFVQAIAPLPLALAYTAASVLNNKVYLLGGCEKPGEQECTNRMFVLDCNDIGKGWEELTPMPARARFLHQMATVGDSIYVLGGLGLQDQDGKIVRELLTETWAFSPEKGWIQLPDMPYAVAAAPTPAPVDNQGNIYILGGDDGSGKKYTPQTNPGFNNQSLFFSTANHTWHDAGNIGAPRAVLPCCLWQGAYVAVNGELKPGRRSAEVWSISFSN